MVGAVGASVQRVSDAVVLCRCVPVWMDAGGALPAGERAFVATGLAPATIFVFRVAAESRIGLGPWSRGAAFRTARATPGAAADGSGGGGAADGTDRATGLHGWIEVRSRDDLSCKDLPA